MSNDDRSALEKEMSFANEFLDKLLEAQRMGPAVLTHLADAYQRFREHSTKVLTAHNDAAESFRNEQNQHHELHLDRIADIELKVRHLDEADAAFQQEKKEFEEKRAQFNDELTSSKALVESLKTDLSKATQDLEVAHLAIEEKDRHVQDLTHAIQSLTETHATETEEHLAAINAANAEISKANEHVSKQDEAITELTSNVKELNARLQTFEIPPHEGQEADLPQSTETSKS